MNDPGPTYGQMITDPLYNPAYSDFCYEEPYMPGLTTYLDTPVVPTQVFVGAAYNNPDCNYPDATPAIKEVDGDGIGPWLSSTGALQLTITALGDVRVANEDYSGPSANVPPFNLKTVKRHYGFGSRPATCGSGANCPNLTIGGVNAVVQSWSDTTIVAWLKVREPDVLLLQELKGTEFPSEPRQSFSTHQSCWQLLSAGCVAIGQLNGVTTVRATTARHRL